MKNTQELRDDTAITKAVVERIRELVFHDNTENNQQELIILLCDLRDRSDRMFHNATHVK